MKNQISQVLAAVLMCTVALTCGCGDPHAHRVVANPDYDAWAAFAPGSYITFEGIQKTDEQAKRIRITEKLLDRDAGKIVLVRTVKFLDSEEKPVARKRIVWAKIAPEDDPRTHPAALLATTGKERVTIGGKTLTCEVRDLKLHAKITGMMATMEDIQARTCVTPMVPGRLVKIHMKTRTPHHDFEITATAVEYKAVPAGKE